MKLLGLLGLLLASSLVHGQYYYLEFAGGTPGDLNQDDVFPVGGGQATGWNEILGPSISTPTWSSDQTIPFAFDFNGAAVTQYKVSSNGVLTFDLGAGTVPGNTPMSLPDASVPDNSICIWGILASGTNDYVSTKTFGTAPNRQHWIHYNSCENGSLAWSYWSIVLEETTNNIYLVDQRHVATGTGSLSAGIQIDGSTAVQVTGSPNLGNQAGSSEGPEDDYYYKFIYGTMPAVDVELLEFDILPYIGTGATDISGTFVNYGANTITAVDITWNDGTGPYTDNVSGLNITTNNSYTFTHATPLNPTAGQAYTIDLTIVATGDVNTANNTLQASTVSLTTIPEKFVVGEEKTGTWCGWCPRGAVGLATMENENNFIGIAVHNNDPMEIPAYDNNLGTYVPGGYPRGGVDRVIDDNPIDFDLMFAQRENEVVPCSVNEITMIYNQTTQKIEVSTEVEFYGNIAGNYRLSLVITEDNVIGDGTSDWLQVNYYTNNNNGNMTDPVSGFEWHNAAADVDPNDFGGYDHVAVHLSDNQILGDASSLPTGTVPTGVYNWDFDDVNVSVLEDIDEAHAVVMVINYDTGEILNAGKTSYTNVGINEKKSFDHQLSLYPNPSSDNVNISFMMDNAADVTIYVTDMLGKVIINTGTVSKSAGQQHLTINGDSLPDGVYFVNLMVGDQLQTEKLIIAK